MSAARLSCAFGPRGKPDSIAVPARFLTCRRTESFSRSTAGRSTGTSERTRLWNERGGAGEPFYSTRAEGTGLGIAIARRIAAARGAMIDRASEEGWGTSVRIVF